MSDDGVTRLPPHRCPRCQHILSAAGTMDDADATPVAGDWTLCAYCLRWLVYLSVTDGVPQLRPITPGEWTALPPAERATLTQQRERVRRAFHQEKPQ